MREQIFLPFNHWEEHMLRSICVILTLCSKKLIKKWPKQDFPSCIKKFEMGIAELMPYSRAVVKDLSSSRCYVVLFPRDCCFLCPFQVLGRMQGQKVRYQPDGKKVRSLK